MLHYVAEWMTKRGITWWSPSQVLANIYNVCSVVCLHYFYIHLYFVQTDSNKINKKKITYKHGLACISIYYSLLDSPQQYKTINK